MIYGNYKKTQDINYENYNIFLREAEVKPKPLAFGGDKSGITAAPLYPSG